MHKNKCQLLNNIQVAHLTSVFFLFFNWKNCFLVHQNSYLFLTYFTGFAFITGISISYKLVIFKQTEEFFGIIFRKDASPIITPFDTSRSLTLWCSQSHYFCFKMYVFVSFTLLFVCNFFMQIVWVFTNELFCRMAQVLLDRSRCEGKKN